MTSYGEFTTQNIHALKHLEVVEDSQDYDPKEFFVSISFQNEEFGSCEELLENSMYEPETETNEIFVDED